MLWISDAGTFNWHQFPQPVFLFLKTFVHVETGCLSLWGIAGWLLMVGPDLLDWPVPFQGVSHGCFVSMGLQASSMSRFCWVTCVFACFPSRFRRLDLLLRQFVLPQTQIIFEIWDAPLQLQQNAQLSSNLPHFGKSPCLHWYFEEQAHYCCRR